MDETQALKYVKASAAALSLPLDEARAERVAAYLLLSAGFAHALEGFALRVSDEPAEIYCPAPFPASQGGRTTP